MPRILSHKLILVALAASVPAIAAAVSASSSEPPAPARSSSSSADEHALECRAAKASVSSELERLRKSCDLAVAAFEACRAARPAWSDVELFSCGFDMSTDLTRGEFDDTASLEDCGAVQQAARADCPVPSCEADIERLTEEAARQVC